MPQAVATLQYQQWWSYATLFNVLYLPGIEQNLFSVGAATDKGCTVTYLKDSFQITNNGKTVAQGVRKSGKLYTMLFRFRKTSSALSAANESSGEIWHKRLGHVNHKILSQMGLVTAEDENKFCEACALGKMSKKSYKASFKGPATDVAMRIHSDTCGPMKNATPGGCRYYILFKDDYSSYRLVYFLKTKDQALEKFKQFLAQAEADTGKNVSILRTDNGTEYLSNQFQQYLRDQLIHHELTAPFTPEQNGKAERDNRTIVECARSMMAESNVGLELWGEAVATAVHILNRVPCKATGKDSPYLRWFGREPKLDYLRVFGCEAYVHIPKEKRTKLQHKATKTIFVGYEERSNTYRLWDIKNRKLFISRSVCFNENAKSKDDGNTVAQWKRAVTIDEPGTDDHDSDTSSDGPDQSFASCVSGDTINDDDSDGSDQPDKNKTSKRNQRTPIERDPYHLRNRPNCNMAFAYSAIEEPMTFQQALTDKYASDWKKAINEELDSLSRNKTWTLTQLPADRKAIKSKWVFRKKSGPDGKITRFKARLVAKGCDQRYGIDYQETFSPVVRMDSIRLMIAIAASKRMKITQFDVKSAFLNGNIDEDIYMQAPEGLSDTNGLVCKLNRSLYGLKQSPRLWNKKFDQFLTKFKLKPTSGDSCMYVSCSEEVHTMLAVYVDDGLGCSTDEKHLKQITDYLSKQFEITILEPKCFVK